MRPWLGIGLVAGSALLAAPSARAEEKTDTSQVRIRRKIAERMTPEQLQAHKERLARARALRKAGRSSQVLPHQDAAADTCPATTPESSVLPFGPVSDTSVGMTDDYDLPTGPPDCLGLTPCTGPPFGRGYIYSGTGTGPDRAYRIRTDANCNLTIDMAPTDIDADPIDPADDLDDLGLIVYDAPCSSNLNDCVCVSDIGDVGVAEQVVLSAVAGTDYFIIVDGYFGDAGPFDLTISGTGCNLVTPPTAYHTVPPCRLVDTRNPSGPFGGPALAAGGSRTFQVTAGSCGIPTTATAVFLNVTVVAPTAQGNLRIFPTGAVIPTVSALNYAASQTRGNNGIYPLDGTGRFDILCTQASGTAHLVVDVAGYFD